MIPLRDVLRGQAQFDKPRSACQRRRRERDKRAIERVIREQEALKDGTWPFLKKQGR